MPEMVRERFPRSGLLVSKLVGQSFQTCIRDDDEEQLAYSYATVLRHHETIRNETAEGGRKSRFLNTNATDEGSSNGTHKKEQMQKRHASAEQEAIAEEKEST